jgi:hypothetical protein
MRWQLVMTPLFTSRSEALRRLINLGMKVPTGRKR